MDPINTLKDLFVTFPGIGKRQAERFVYFLLRQNKQFASTLAKAIQELSTGVATCPKCQRFFVGDNTKGDTCNICSDVTRDKKLLLIVAKDVDLENIEHSGNYKGFYFVLGGTIPILDKAPEQRIRIDSLSKTLEKQKPKEVILALSTNPEGENTRKYITKNLSKLQKGGNFSITTLGRGLSTGAELEYSDPDTIKSALANREATL